ncbi:hypothetical protein [Paracoccus indicus]|uniref:hypothetical protein n=1 Tax=Paracoccus indicus TaxID=2079229 RepID=UPI0013B40D0C|nr:hypothetical protein [Paracoccus indicus]
MDVLAPRGTDSTVSHREARDADLSSSREGGMIGADVEFHQQYANEMRAVELCRCEVCTGLLTDLVGLTQFTELALQFLDPVLLRARQTAALTGITFGLLAQGTQTVEQTAKLQTDLLVGSRVTGVVGAVLLEEPNIASTQFGRIRGGEPFRRHRTHPLSILPSTKPGTVHRGAQRQLPVSGLCG